ncbi:SDR family NAD(P)-dependent oxidoreductase [Microbulbifer hainanensis]|uniref:SDR family NAD(P)-dependent oxidoreductase n=1 Tax=Microbulbifer hainanensis TaxID=2735675 RepID=UPI001865D313|nr:SDR family oxidoreductase [Microbulbifer hainanensis]
MTTTSSKVLLVTGANSGIGQAIANKFTRQGWKVMLAGRNRDRLQDTATPLAESAIFSGDLRDNQYCCALVAETVAHFGRLDALVNCAGIIFRKTAPDTTDNEWRESMATNLDAPFFLSRAAIPHLVESRGSIVNIASDWGLHGGQQAAAYCASKGALVMLTKAMALDHATDGVTINAICPGDVDTPMLEKEAIQRGVEYANAMVENDAAVPTGRITRPEEVASLCYFLCSEEARQITGSAMLIDGGANA